MGVEERHPYLTFAETRMRGELQRSKGLPAGPQLARSLQHPYEKTCQIGLERRPHDQPLRFQSVQERLDVLHSNELSTDDLTDGVEGNGLGVQAAEKLDVATDPIGQRLVQSSDFIGSCRAPS